MKKLVIAVIGAALLATPAVAGPDLAIVSAASFKSPVSPAAIAVATGIPFETQGAAITVLDSAGTTRNAAIYSSEPGQITFRVPTNSSVGVASVNITSVNVDRISDVRNALASG